MNVKTWPFKPLNIRTDNLTSVVLRTLAIEQPAFKGVYPIFDTQGKGKPTPVWVEGHGVVSGVLSGITPGSFIFLNCNAVTLHGEANASSRA